MGVGRESVSGRENRCKGPVAGRNIAHPASCPRNFKKVCVTGAQEPEVRGRGAQDKSWRSPQANQTQNSERLDDIIYHPNCHTFECTKMLNWIVCWHYMCEPGLSGPTWNDNPTIYGPI